MKKHTVKFLLVSLVLPLTGCLMPMIPQQYGGQGDMDMMTKRINILSGYQSNPDADAWYEQRQKMSQALGDRVFDKDFGRVYDSLVVAISTMELKVNNMERVSGYIQASGITLLPTESKTLFRAAVGEWCKYKGIDSSVLDQQYSSSTMGNAGAATEASVMTKIEKEPKSLTFQLVKMGEGQTKVKLRFAGVYYPSEMEAFYKLVWQAVDKQIFIDKNIEGAVEERK